MESKRSPVLWNEPNKLCRPSSLARAMYPVDVAKRRSDDIHMAMVIPRHPCSLTASFFPPQKKSTETQKRMSMYVYSEKNHFFRCYLNFPGGVIYMLFLP